jgi:hypothetical protein
MAATLVQYAKSNVLLQESSLPVTLQRVSSYALLPLTPRAAAHFADPAVNALSAAAATDAATDALSWQKRTDVYADFGSVHPGASQPASLAVAVATMGRRCGTLAGTWASLLLAGNFSYARHFDNATGAALHTFTCVRCFVDELSQLSFVLDSSCQSLSVTLAAAGVGGGISVASAYALATKASQSQVTFPLVLEVIQDEVIGTASSSDGLVLGGRSAAGYLVLPTAGLQSSTTSAASSGTVALTIHLTLQVRAWLCGLASSFFIAITCMRAPLVFLFLFVCSRSSRSTGCRP